MRSQTEPGASTFAENERAQEPIWRALKLAKMYLKINRSVKTTCLRPSLGVGRSGLWALEKMGML